MLVVDDDPEIRVVLRDTLRNAGLDVAMAGNGREALEYLRREPEPCLLLLDLIMPIMNGWQFRAAQLQDPELARLPVIVMTATSSLEDAAIHADGILPKPVSLTVLLRAVGRFCELAPAAVRVAT